jgi:hypothetical protein
VQSVNYYDLAGLSIGHKGQSRSSSVRAAATRTEQRSVTKDDSARESAGGDPVAAAHQAAHAFSPDSQAAKQVERAAAAYGKEGEDNGVEVGFDTSNEVPKSDGPKGDKNSPDDLLFNCTFDMQRLKGEARTRAISHVGTQIADLRDPQSKGTEVTAYELEYRAWQKTVLSAVANHNALYDPESTDDVCRPSALEEQ